MPNKFKCSDKQQVIFLCNCVTCNIWDILMLKNYSWLSEIQTIVLYQALVVQREASWHIIEEPYGNAPWQGSGDSLQPTAREKLMSSLQQALSNWILWTITRVSLEVGPPSLLLRMTTAQTNPTVAVSRVTLSQRTQGGKTWIPDLQKLCNNRCLVL